MWNGAVTVIGWEREEVAQRSRTLRLLVLEKMEWEELPP